MDNRRQPRFTVEGVHGKLTFASEVEILNMSLSGVALRLDRRLNIGSEYALKLEVEDTTVSVQGTIVWAALDEVRKRPGGDEDAVYSAGMRFTDIVTPRLAHLLEFIDRNKLIPDKRLGGVRFSINASGKALLDVPQPYVVKVISLRGMLIEADHSLEKESRCPMEITLENGEPLVFDGRVAFREQVAEGEGPVLWHLGIEFVEMSIEDRIRLDAFIQSLSAR
jgi:PilZ domain